MRVLLKKVADLSSKHRDRGGHPLRSAEVAGYSPYRPTLGMRYVVTNAQPLTPGTDTRCITTSRIMEVVREDVTGAVFRTRNSEYEVTYLPEEEV